MKEEIQNLLSGVIFKTKKYILMQGNNGKIRI